ncbi:dTDP-4-dehydrorhamnose reductase family protein [Pedobacter kyonggii]|uniref:dTDP-4-dehydrorhamnose reductase n=1 Tax=Pedobacter kyonggii TaxID=1926871 RepID=A0A4Q9HER5_9SPHI|nr:SDR family oxidoreductase [Pedobacter kyonggii]TBO43305.1 SDR family oxidoreductase [Pedobacter kyonggii]
MKRILVFGAAGMAGHVIYTVLKEKSGVEVFGTIHRKGFDELKRVLDIYDSAKVEEVISDLKPDVVINCIGVLIREAKSNPANAIYANSYYPHFLARICKQHNCKLIHISTDCVFSGKNGDYTETSVKDAIDVYGISKGLGEVVDETNLTIRTSIIGPELSDSGEGLFDWFMKQNGVVHGYKSAIWSGITTLELAKFILWVLERELTGLIHLTNNMPINKFDLLSLFNNVYNKNIQVSDQKDYQVDKSFRNTNMAIDYVVPSYEEMLFAQKEFMNEHQSYYTQYTYS